MTSDGSLLNAPGGRAGLPDLSRRRHSALARVPVSGHVNGHRKVVAGVEFVDFDMRLPGQGSNGRAAGMSATTSLTADCNEPRRCRRSVYGRVFRGKAFSASARGYGSVTGGVGGVHHLCRCPGEPQGRCRPIRHERSAGVGRTAPHSPESTRRWRQCANWPRRGTVAGHSHPPAVRLRA